MVEADDLPTLQLRTMLATLGVDSRSLAASPSGTIKPPQSRPRTQDDAFIDALPTFELVSEGQPGGDLTLGALIGEGGMGVVLQATQVPLHREVAVKRARSKRNDDEVTLALLREAWITGGLEHPNIVPVHTLGRDAAGAPMFVMKRIDGVAWSALIRDPELHPRGSKGDPLGMHLDILQQVCNAVAFAHSRGILHRDLKPDNVMVGAFGEVYVLDWGLALALKPRPGLRLPLAADFKGIAGTPHYMAPEMVEGDGARFDERTDVFLLGALLHEVLTGRPRHGGRTAMEVLACAWRSASHDFDASVAADLGAICNRACADKSELRYGSAEAFRAALDEFTRRRHALALIDGADERLAGLGQQIEAWSGAGDNEPVVEATFAECRFGYQLALSDWPESVAAAKGQRAACLLMAGFEIDRGHAHAAAGLLAGLDPADAALAARLEQLNERLAAEQADLAKLQVLDRELDMRIGARTRAFVALVMGVLYSIVPLLTGLAVRQGWIALDGWSPLVMAVGFAALLGFGCVWARESLFSNEANRRIVRALWSLAAALGMLATAGMALDLPPLSTMTFELVLFFLFTAMLASTIDRRLYASALAFLLAFGLGTLWPACIFEAMAFGNLFGSLIIAVYWRPSAAQTLAGPAPPPQRLPGGQRR